VVLPVPLTHLELHLEPVTSSVSGCRSGTQGSATESLTCYLARQDPDRGPSDSPAFTPLILVALGPL